MKRILRILTILLIGSLPVSVSRLAFAQPYGQGAYGSSTYGNGVIQIGPVILPVTGAGILAIISIAIIALGVGLYAWARQRRKRVNT